MRSYLIFKFGDLHQTSIEVSPISLLVKLAIYKTGGILGQLKSVSEMLGVTRNVLTLWLSGKHKPYKKNVLELLKITGVPEIVFYDSQETTKNPPKSPKSSQKSPKS